MSQTLLTQLKELIGRLRTEKKEQAGRFVPLGDLLTDRAENAKAYGFGEGSTCYDNVLILGDVAVGRHSWIGPNVILDGTGGLWIGDYCSISAGVQIYSHETVKWSTSLGVEDVSISDRPTIIGDGVYLGPQVIVQMGVEIGDKAVIGANSFVNRDIPSGCVAWGTPARIVRRSDTPY